MRIRKTLAAVAVLAAATGSLTACNDSETARTAAPAAGSSAPSTPSPADASGAEDTAAGDSSGGHLDKAGLVEAVTSGPVKAGSAHVTMSMGGAASLTAEGDVDYRGSTPEMSMTMSMAQLGSGRMEMRFVDGILYMTIPQVTPAGKFMRIDPQDKSNPMSETFGSITKQMDPLNSIRSLKAGVRTVEFVGAESVDGEDADHYRVTVNTAAMLKAMGQKHLAGMPRTLTYDMWLDGKDLLRRMRFTLSGMQVDMSMSRWGEPVDVHAPPPGKVVDASSLMGGRAG